MYLTLLAIVLSIGLVVDDAIVMMENIYVKIEQGMSPLEAGLKGSSEIFFAIIATTITLIAVFFPIVFLEGMTGRLFREFSIVIAGAVAISSFVALTLTPMLSTKILRTRHKRSKAYNFTEKFFVKMNQTYQNSMDTLLKSKYIALLILLVSGISIVYLWRIIPAEMAPLEDRSQFNVNITTPEGSTYEYNYAYSEDVAALVEETVPEADKVTQMVRGGSFAFCVL
jgi:multidrug efflux pump